jgi:hypothetical protein
MSYAKIYVYENGEQVDLEDCEQSQVNALTAAIEKEFPSTDAYTSSAYAAHSGPILLAFIPRTESLPWMEKYFDSLRYIYPSHERWNGSVIEISITSPSW